MLTFAPRAAAADLFAASVLACAAESDRDRRLDCYDQAVASFTAKLTNNQHRAPASASAAVAPPAAPAIATAPAGAANEAPQAAQPPAQAAIASAPSSDNAKNAGSGTAIPRHFAAKVSSIDYFPDHLVIHLDNSQVWEQVAEGQLNLHIGDEVTIDKQMGSYWLSGNRGGALQVKLKPAKPAS